MAFLKTGGFVVKALKFPLVNPCFVIPSTVNIQSRNAARKGYRDKQRQLKKASKVKEVAKKEKVRIWTKVVKIEKTVDPDKPEPPEDDIFIKDHFKHAKYSLLDALKFHREYHDPSVFNNPEAAVNVLIEISMYGKKLTQVLKPFNGVATMPHPFVLRHKKAVLVICDPEDVPLAMESGASVAGGQELVKKIQAGVIQPSLYEYIICHLNTLPLINPIRGLLKHQVPRLKLGTVTTDLKSAIYKFLHGAEYTCVEAKADTPFGYINCSIGTINMELAHLEENFKSLLQDVLKHRPHPGREFITWIWCQSPPSVEQFSIDLSLYLEEKKEKDYKDDDDDDDDDNDDEISEEKKEKLELKRLQKQVEEEASSG